MSELNKIVDASTFQERVGKMITQEAGTHPDLDPEQIVTIAHEKCRETFGLSKALLVYFIEKSRFLTEESRKDLTDLLRADMTKDEFIELGLLWKSEGLSAKEVAKKLPYKSTWVKQNIHPLLNTVAEKRLATPDLLKWVGSVSVIPASAPVVKCQFQDKPVPVLQKQELGKFYLNDLKKESREFSIWGSVEVVDSQGDKIAIAGLREVMPIVMRRGGTVLFGHTNRPVGRLTKYEFKDKIVDGEKVPGILLHGHVFSDYEIDDAAWEAVQLAQANNLPVMSLGATPTGHPERECDGDVCWNLYKKAQVYEWTITDIAGGSIGANPEATVEKVRLAKSESESPVPEEDLVDLMRSVIPEAAAFSSAALLTSIERDLMANEECDCRKTAGEKNPKKPKIYPGSGDDQMDTRGKPRKRRLGSMPGSGTLTGKSKDDTMSEEEEEQTEEEESVEKPGDADIAVVLDQIMQRLMAVEEKLNMNEADAPPAQEAGGEEKALTLSKEDFAKLAEEQGYVKVETLNKEQALEEQVLSILQKQGFQNRGRTPAPQAEIRKITTGGKFGNHTSGPRNYPTPEEFNEATRKGKLGELRRRYNI